MRKGSNTRSVKHQNNLIYAHILCSVVIIFMMKYGQRIRSVFAPLFSSPSKCISYLRVSGLTISFIPMSTCFIFLSLIPCVGCCLCQYETREESENTPGGDVYDVGLTSDLFFRFYRFICHCESYLVDISAFRFNMDLITWAQESLSHGLKIGIRVLTPFISRFKCFQYKTAAVFRILREEIKIYRTHKNESYY